LKTADETDFLTARQIYVICSLLYSKKLQLRRIVLAKQVEEGWINGLRLKHIAHSSSAANCVRNHRLIGIPNIITSSVAGTSVFATLVTSPSLGIVIATGSLSVASAILAGLNVFFDHATEAGKHKSAAARYGALRRELEQFLLVPASPTDKQKFLRNLKQRWDAIEAEAPTISQKIHDKADKVMHLSIDTEAKRDTISH
jgi:hypothetical protein